MKAVWRGTVIAESDDVVNLRGRYYFPLASLRGQHFVPSSETSTCFWKGTAHYFDIVVGDDVNPGAAWTYRTPRPLAAAIAGRVAFWKGVRVES